MNTWVKNIINGIVSTKLDRLEEFSNELGVTLPELALAWILRQHNIASTLVGATNPEQIEANAKASDLVLGFEEIKRIEAILTV